MREGSEWSCVPYLVEIVSGLSEGNGDAGAQEAAGSVAVRQAGHRSLALQRRETHLNGLTEQQHGLRHRVAGAERRENREERTVTIKIHL